MRTSLRTLAFALGLTALAPTIPLSPAAPVAFAASGWSLVYEGRIVDIGGLQTTEGDRLSASDLAAWLGGLGDVSIQTRPDRGLIVIDGRHGGGDVSEVKGFETQALTLMVNDQQLSVQCELRDGVPFLSPSTAQAVLKALGFSVTLDEGSGLLAVARAPSTAATAPAMAGGGSAAGATGMPGAGFPQMVLQGAGDALGVFGMGAASPVTAERSAVVCGAMDQLRQAWHITEPTRAEKRTFQELADRFQAAQNGDLEVSEADAAELEKALRGFKAKVDQRAKATREWQAPPEAARVKLIGNQFMSSYSTIMDTMYQMTQDMTAGTTYPVEEIDAKVEEVKAMERQIQSIGPSFDAEVMRVRGMYGCGPATLSSPGS